MNKKIFILKINRNIFKVGFFVFVMKLKIRYYPQYASYSCGPVSLKMVFDHLGKHYSEEKLIKLCHAIPNNGTSHEHLIEEVKREGFKFVEGHNGSINDIIFYLNNGYPVIVNYINPLSGGGHYSVIDGYDEKENVLIFADPSNGNDYTLHFNKFKKLWHNSKGISIGWFLIIGREKIVIN